MIGKKKRGPVPGDKARVKAEAEEEKLIASIQGDIARLSPHHNKTFVERVAELAACKARVIPVDLIAEGNRRGVSARELLGLFERREMFGELDKEDNLRWRKIRADLKRADDLKKIPLPVGFSAPVGYETGDSGERLRELAMMDRISELASKRRGMTPPFPGEAAIRETFIRWRGSIGCKGRWIGTDWGDAEQWPTVADVMGLLGMSRTEVGALARSGRWGNRDVWAGAECPNRGLPKKVFGKKNPRLPGGRPALRLKAKAVAKVLRGFAKKHPGLSSEAESLARYLSVIRGK